MPADEDYPQIRMRFAPLARLRERGVLSGLVDTAGIELSPARTCIPRRNRLPDYCVKERCSVNLPPNDL